MTKKNISKLVCIIVLAATVLLAGSNSSERWIQGSKTEFLKGTPLSASITSDGTIILPPQSTKILPVDNRTAVQPFIWEIAVNKTGQLYFGGGNEGIIYDSRGNPLHDADKPEVYAMDVGPDNYLYFATSPAGAVQRIGSSGKAEMFFNPADINNGRPERYIWDMAFDSSGNLWLATGIEGRIYKVTPNGTGKVMFDSDEAHITCLKIDSRDRIIFGSEPGGQIFQMTTDGKVFVLFDSDMKEISGVAVDSTGVIYATAVAEGALKEDDSSKANGKNGTEPDPVLTRTGSIAISPTEDGSANNGAKSALYRILPDNSVEILWSSSRHIAYAVVIDGEGNAVFGTGPNGQLISINKNGVERVLRQLEGSQVTALLSDRGNIYAGVSNLGGVYRLSGGYANRGEFISQVKDTGSISDFGAIRWTGENGRINLRTRTGNTEKPDNTWSDWSNPYGDPVNAKIESPAARFIQWKAELVTSDPAVTPILKNVSVFFLQKNIRPRVKSVSVLPAGISFKEGMSDPDVNEIPGSVINELKQFGITIHTMTGYGKAVYRQSMRSFTWKASDANDDILSYNVYYRSIDDSDWILLSRDLDSTVFTFDSRELPDGTYIARIEASDKPSNSSERMKTNYLDSQPFDVDNTPPIIKGLAGTVSGKVATVKFDAEDNYSTIASIRVKVDAGRWHYVLPEDAIPDSQMEKITVTLPDLSSGSHVITILAEDSLGNNTSGTVSIMVR